MARRLRQSFFAAVLVAAVPISASAQNGAAEGSGMTRPVVFPSVSGRIAYQANGGTRFASGGSGGLSGAAAATITIGGGNAGF